jgi:prophage regulatory protein
MNSQPNKRPSTDLDFKALVLRKREVCAMLAISLAHLDRLRRSGDFPSPIRLGPQAIGWSVNSVLTWVATRPTLTQ